MSRHASAGTSGITESAERFLFREAILSVKGHYALMP